MTTSSTACSPADIRGVIFDLDGTLADTIPICIFAYQYAFVAAAGLYFTHGEIEAMFGPNEEGILANVLPDAWRSALPHLFKAYEAAHRLCEEPFPGIVGLLQSLRERGVRTALVTGKGEGTTRITLDRLGLAEYLDPVEVGSMQGSIKAESIGKVLAHWGLAPEQVAYVGDATADVQNARAAGVIPIAAAWAATSAFARGADPDGALRFSSVADLSAWLQPAP